MGSNDISEGLCHSLYLSVLLLCLYWLHFCCCSRVSRWPQATPGIPTSSPSEAMIVSRLGIDNLGLAPLILPLSYSGHTHKSNPVTFFLKTHLWSSWISWDTSWSGPCTSLISPLITLSWTSCVPSSLQYWHFFFHTSLLLFLLVLWPCSTLSLLLIPLGKCLFVLKDSNQVFLSP